MIHRYWTGPNDPPESSAVAKAIVRNSLETSITDWTDETLPPDIAQAVDAVTGFVPEQQVARHRSNVVRLHLLHKFGGTYMDHDFILFRRPGPIEIAAHPGRSGAVCPCYMSFPAGHPLIADAISRIAPAESSTIASGSRMLNTVFDATVRRIPLPFSHEGALIGREPDFWGIHLSVRSLGELPKVTSWPRQ